MSEIASLQNYTNNAYEASWRITKSYSTSFSLGIRLFHSELRPHIAAIYGMVRVADEIVDSWHELDQQAELDRFEADCYLAIKEKYSSNLILHAFAQTVDKFHIDKDHIKAFFESMRMDLGLIVYDDASYERYIFGSAEVIGLMCLSVFVAGDKRKYRELEPGARSLGSAFQKVNFLRDIQADSNDLGRMYFPGMSFETFSESDKVTIIQDIEDEFNLAKKAIDNLPSSSKRGVSLAWRYYSDLLEMIKKTPVDDLKSRRVRVGDIKKSYRLIQSFIVI